MARILVVDDAAIIREKLKLILQKNGHQVVGEAANGLEASLIYRKCRPDIVTMDITMPQVDGVEGCRRIRAIDSNAAIIMISAMGQKAIILEAIEAGAMGFIVKPFETDKVLSVIQATENHRISTRNRGEKNQFKDEFDELKKQKHDIDGQFGALRK